MLSTIERVLALQKNEIFAEISAEGLAYLAAIAEEVEFNAKDRLFAEGAVPEACFLILAGNVELSRRGTVELKIGAGEDISVWALFDGEPHAFAAQATENTHALKINREEFYDLLADHTDIIQALFSTLVKRVRRLLGEQARAGGKSPSPA